MKMFVVPLDGSGSSLVDWKEAAGIVRRFQDHRNRSPDGTKQATVVLLLDDDDGQCSYYI